MALVLTDQVRPRCPGGHVDLDLRAAGGGNGRFNFDVVRVRRREAQRVADRIERLRLEIRDGNEEDNYRFCNEPSHELRNLLWSSVRLPPDFSINTTSTLGSSSSAIVVFTVSPLRRTKRSATRSPGFRFDKASFHAFGDLKSTPPRVTN